MQEAEFSKLSWKELCPVLFNLPLGFLIIMPRTKPLKKFNKQTVVLTDRVKNFVELKKDSFGILDGNVNFLNASKIRQKRAK